MNWYKKAQQNTFPFLKNIPKSSKPPIEETEPFQKLMKRTPELLKDLIEQCKDFKEAVQTLKIYKFNFKLIKDIIVVYLDKPYIIDNVLDFVEPHDWIWNINDWDLDQYVENYPDFNKDFWESPIPVYHGTFKKYWPLIQKEGLEIKNETRGINNRSTGSAVFTSDNPDDIQSYGDMIIEINTQQMKQDGYMPQVNREEPIIDAEKRDTLAHLIGLEDFYTEVEQDLSPSTIIFFGNIPAKYLKIISP